MKIETKPYNPPWFIKTYEEIADYLNDASLEEYPHFFLKALDDLAKIKGNSKCAKQSGLNLENFYKVFSGKAEPIWSTV